jgi:hypothetical protein
MPGETDAELYMGYLTNHTITGLYAEAISGAVVMIERTVPFASVGLGSQTNPRAKIDIGANPRLMMS